MALTLLGLSGYQSGIEVAETAINLESFSCEYYPEFYRELQNHIGQTIGAAVPTIPSSTIQLKGEVNAGTNLMAATFVAAQTVTNDTALFGRSAGIYNLRRATESQTRNGFRTIDMELRSHPLWTAN